MVWASAVAASIQRAIELAFGLAMAFTFKLDGLAAETFALAFAEGATETFRLALALAFIGGATETFSFALATGTPRTERLTIALSFSFESLAKLRRIFSFVVISGKLLLLIVL